MKKIYLLISLSFIVTNFLSQTYYQFPTDSAQWNVKLTCQVSMCPPNALVCPYQTLQKGDTTINGKIYHKLYDLLSSNSLHSFYRESNKIIYSKYPLGGVFGNDTAEFVLYNFNLNIGDSLSVKIPSSWINTSGPITKQPKIYLTSTGTISVNSSNHKTYSFSSNNFGGCSGGVNPIWIEGVGSTSGLFYNLNYNPWAICMSYPAPYNVFLTCFTRNYYLYPYMASGCVTGLSDNETDQTNFKLFPNPNNGKFKIQISNETPNLQTIFIKNALGQIISSFENPSNELHIDDITKGIYFISFIYSDKTITKKLIVE